MSEVTARELRRLQSLDARVKKAQEEKRAAERKSAVLQRALDQSQARAREAADRLDGLVAENRQLAADLESAVVELKLANSAADRAGVEIAEARRLAAESRAEADQAQATIKRLSGSVRKLTERCEQVEAQLEQKGVDPVVPADRLGELVAAFVANLGSGLGDLQITSGELKLQMGVALVNGRPGFVVPTPSSSQETLSNLHEVGLTFTRPPLSGDA